MPFKIKAPAGCKYSYGSEFNAENFTQIIALGSISKHIEINYPNGQIHLEWMFNTLNF